MRQPDQSEDASLEVAVAQAIEACDGDLRATIQALIVANEFLETQVSRGYRRGMTHGDLTATRDENDGLALARELRTDERTRLQSLAVA
jgi:hypothetical protein